MAQVSFQDAGGRLYGEMQKCIIYIQNHPDQDITMEDLAERMENPSPFTIDFLIDSRSFMRATTFRLEGSIPAFSRKISISFLVPEPFP